MGARALGARGRGMGRGRGVEGGAACSVPRCHCRCHFILPGRRSPAHPNPPRFICPVKKRDPVLTNRVHLLGGGCVRARSSPAVAVGYACCETPLPCPPDPRPPPPNRSGRAPSAFDPANVHTREGRLDLVSRYDPTYAFPCNPPNTENQTAAYGNWTTAMVESRHMVRYGFFEVRSKYVGGAPVERVLGGGRA